MQTNKEDTIYQHEVNLGDKESIGQIINLISIHTDQIKDIKEKIGD